MQSSIRIVASLVLLSSVLASYQSSTKLRRDGVLNLYPFPRVGRASRNTWQVPLNDFFLAKSIDYEPVEKRQLYAFPRVGRSELALLRDQVLAQGRIDFKPVPARRAEDSPGMWFGPRLGRSVKSEEDDFALQTGINERSEPEQIETVHDERKKREANLM